MENRRFSCNSETYTNKHNDIMDELLWACANTRHFGIGYSFVTNQYFPTNTHGVEILEHLCDMDLIQEVFLK